MQQRGREFPVSQPISQSVSREGHETRLDSTRLDSTRFDSEDSPDSFPAGAGWPSFHQSNSHASPLLYDADNDGVEDILVATYDGEILFFK